MWAIIVYSSLAFLLYGNDAVSVLNGDSAEKAASNHPVLDVVNWSLGEIQNVSSRWIRQIERLKNGTSRIFGIFRPDVTHQECTTPFGSKGRCRHLQHCLFGQHRTLDLLPFTCIIEGRYVGVCCPEGQENPAPIPAGLPGSQEAGQLPAIDPGLPGSGPGNTTTPAPDSSSSASPPGTEQPQVRGCGVSTVSGARIVGGQAATPKDWPWMAALLVSKTEQFCGGVLITDQHVLTAAHCLVKKNAEDISIRLGEYDLGLNNETRAQNFRVTEMRLHEDFSKSTYENDIAILKLHRKAAFNSYIWPICLPPPGQSYENRMAVVTGWGTVSYGGPASDVLMEVSVPVWNQKRCSSRFAQPVLNTTLCAGAYEGGKDSCQGDSGGPLMLQLGSARWAVIGVVSWGIRCGERNTPGIYTRVNSYLPWIVENAVY